MTRSTSLVSRALRLTLAACCVVAIPARVRAQKVPAGCQQLIDAERKMITTPHHVLTTEAPARAGEPGRTSEGISTTDAIYIQVRGAWKRSPWTPKQALAQMDTNLTTGTAFSCIRVGDESVAGATATVYTAHTENAGRKSDTRIWVAKGSGLVLRIEEDLDTGGGEKRHRSTRYDYANVQAPAGVK